MADTLSAISIIAFVAAGICLVIAAILFWRFKIPSVIGDLSGRNARKSIEQLRRSGEEGKTKPHSPGKTNLERGKLTETMKGIRKKKEKTEKLQARAEETTLLANTERMAEETTLLAGTEKMAEETTLLTDTEKMAEETTLLNEPEQTGALPQGGRAVLEMLDEILLVHTSEEMI